MTGLELSKAYFEEIGLPMLRTQFQEYLPRIAVGLVGEGSECFGFDDEVSHDHDFGPGFCLWLTKADYTKIGVSMQASYTALPLEYKGFLRQTSPQGTGRVGVFEIGAFYHRFTGLRNLPHDNRTWLRLPESYLATVTNGTMFQDPLGEFSAIRDGYLSFYPEDVRRKKLAARAIHAAQAGQYNFSRCMKHGEPVAAGIAVAEFVRATISMAHLLNRRYMPYYKWMHRSLRQLPTFSELAKPLKQLTLLGCTAKNQMTIAHLIEEICQKLIWALWDQGLTSTDSDFLQDHAYELMQNISDPELRKLHIMEG